MADDGHEEDEVAAFGQGVRARRKALGLSQEQLAEAADLHRNYIGGIERGERNVSLRNIYKLARGLQVTPAELFAPVHREPRDDDVGKPDGADASGRAQS